MENMAPVRPPASNGNPGSFLVRSSSDDSSHPVIDKQVQLAGWREKPIDCPERIHAEVKNPPRGGGQACGSFTCLSS